MRRVDLFWKSISIVLVFALLVLMIPQMTGCSSGKTEETMSSVTVQNEGTKGNEADGSIPIIKVTKNEVLQDEFIIENGEKDLENGYNYIANVANMLVDDEQYFEFIVEDNKGKADIEYKPGRYYIRLSLEKGWIYGCIEKKVWHIGLLVKDAVTNKLFVDIHIASWFDKGPGIGIYNSGQTYPFCINTQAEYGKIKNAVKEILKSQGVPEIVALSIGAVVSIYVLVNLGILMFGSVGVALANDSTIQNPSQPIEYSDKINYIALPKAQTTLFNYYSMNDVDLPSLFTRSQFYELLGLGSAGEYYGTAEQNTLLLNALKEKGICPTTVEELKEAIGYVEPLPTKEDASFKQDPGRASDPEMPEFVDLGFKKQGEEFRIKLFVFNPSDTNLVWLPNSGYGLWNNMKKNGFNEVPDFISVDYTTSPNNAWTIEIVAKIPSNPGKKTLTFRMSFNIDGRQFGSYLNYVVNILGLATDVGKNAPNQSEWQQLYYASGGEKEVGLPYDDCGGVLVHRVGSALFQDFATGKAGKGAFIRGDGVKAVHWVHGSIWEKYTSIASPIEKYGAPMTEEYSFNGKIRQDFERASFYFDKTNNQVTIIEYNGSNTQSTNPADYHCKWSSQTPANPVTIKAGNSATLRLRLLNLGPATWYSGTVNLGTARPQDRIPFYPRGTGWRQTGDANRILLFEPTVKPGEIGTFYFTISIPKTTKPGTYREYFRPVADNITWMEDYGIYWDIKVVK